ncbi:hypothetical protein N7478_012009 [Penicillium angulare]|uniref:uncharacterized protein n=1 Tax=Penicillium angulare TaxID=116970 RepID=UPI00253FB8FA|nr:uncharacterized protein N7478_012009 [Penicillium angulare]KAJ5261414.1 hypothetical protein N7478_012009 [Penicillium angulare]
MPRYVDSIIGDRRFVGSSVRSFVESARWRRFPPTNLQIVSIDLSNGVTALWKLTPVAHQQNRREPGC